MEFEKSLKVKITKEQFKVIKEAWLFYWKSDEFVDGNDFLEFMNSIAHKESFTTIGGSDPIGIALEYED